MKEILDRFLITQEPVSLSLKVQINSNGNILYIRQLKILRVHTDFQPNNMRNSGDPLKLVKTGETGENY